jgi:hypothetical protein
MPGEQRNIGFVLCVVFALVLLVLLAIAVVGGTLAPPPPWLESWTAWILSAVSVVFAPLVLQSVARALQKFAGRG